MKQTAGKFDELDRKRVIDAVQEHYDVKLEKVGNARKWLRDELCRNWVILGGKDDWHGIPNEIMEHEKETRTEGMLVVAEKKLTHIEVFAGPLSQLVSSKDELSQTKTEACQFTVKVKGDLMQCVQAPAVVLKRIVSISHSDEDRERERRMNEFGKMVADLSPEEFSEFLDKLGLNEEDRA